MYHKYELEFPNSWQDILNVAETNLTGELEYRRGNYTLEYGWRGAVYWKYG